MVGCCGGGGFRDRRIRVVRHVGGEAARHECRSEERPARGAAASHDRQDGSGMAEREGHGRKYAGDLRAKPAHARRPSYNLPSGT